MRAAFSAVENASAHSDDGAASPLPSHAAASATVADSARNAGIISGADKPRAQHADPLLAVRSESSRFGEAIADDGGTSP